MSDLDKFLTEAMGGCWHETTADGSYKCEQCGNVIGCNVVAFSRDDFSTWEGFGKLWEWAVGSEWWNRFIDSSSLYEGYESESCREYKFKIVNPDRFATAIYEYLKPKETP